jgi:hypothetical protein
MLKRLISAAAVLALATVVSTAANAQDSTAMKAGVVVKPSYDVFVTAVNGTPATITALKANPSFTADQVTLVNLRDITADQPDSSVVVLLKPHAAEIEELRSVLGTQAVVTGVLQKNTPALTTADVIAVGQQPDGRLLVFYRVKTQ